MSENRKDFISKLIFWILCIIAIVLLILVFIDGCNSENKHSEGTADVTASSTTDKDIQISATQKPKEPVWYEQAEIPDAKEIEYTPPANEVVVYDDTDCFSSIH